MSEDQKTTDRALLPCQVCGAMADKTTPRRELVADLLAALEWFIDDIDGTHTAMLDFDANVARARVAIAKARGAKTHG